MIFLKKDISRIAGFDQLDISFLCYWVITKEITEKNIQCLPVTTIHTFHIYGKCNDNENSSDVPP